MRLSSLRLPSRSASSGSWRLRATASAETRWPTRPVKFIVPLGVGSGADIGARLLADRLSQRWGQPVIVDNRPGGDALVAINAFVSAHDDHILCLWPVRLIHSAPYQHDSLPYKQAIWCRSHGSPTPSSSSRSRPSIHIDTMEQLSIAPAPNPASSIGPASPASTIFVRRDGGGA